MMVSNDLLNLARRLVTSSGEKRPKQVYLKRAVSTAYYAVFHAIARSNADIIHGVVKTQRSEKAWQQAYRGLQHGPAKKACMAARSINFPDGILQCASGFVSLQEIRHLADYDPLFRLTRQGAIDVIETAKAAIEGLTKAPKKDRRAFATLVLFNRG